MTDSNLIELAESNRSVERSAITDSLYYLKEIETRRLFSSLGYQSLFEFAVKHLKHSEDEAYRRISAMRLLKEIPGLEEKINSGELSLTNLNQAQTLFRREARENGEVSIEDKIDFLSRIEGKSKREAEKIIAGVSPEVHLPDKIRPLSQTQVLVSFTADVSILAKFEKLKGLFAHSNPDLTLGELTNWLCDVGIAALDKVSPAPARVKSVSVPSRPISKAAIRKAVWARDGGRCQNCNSTYAVQIDHIKPRGLGGEDTVDNLRLLCRNCNQRAAIKVYGRRKMGRFINSHGARYRV